MAKSINRTEELHYADALVCEINNDWMSDGIRVQYNTFSIGKPDLFTIMFINDKKNQCSVMKYRVKLRDLTGELFTIRSTQLFQKKGYC